MYAAQYNRLHVRCDAPRVAVLRAARRMLSKQGKGRAMRAARHAWLRRMLREHDHAFVQYLAVKSGRI